MANGSKEIDFTIQFPAEGRTWQEVMEESILDPDTDNNALHWAPSTVVGQAAIASYIFVLGAWQSQDIFLAKLYPYSILPINLWNIADLHDW